MATPEQLARLTAVVPFAQTTQRRWHVPASVTLAQWMFESGWGASEIVVKANNCFGIKCTDKTGKTPYMEFRTPEGTPPHQTFILADFVKYDSVAASFEDHGRLLGSTDRYAPALSYLPSIPDYCRRLQISGYSSNQRYAVSLVAQIRAHDLEQYDVWPDDPRSARKAA